MLIRSRTYEFALALLCAALLAPAGFMTAPTSQEDCEGGDCGGDDSGGGWIQIGPRGASAAVFPAIRAVLAYAWAGRSLARPCGRFTLLVPRRALAPRHMAMTFG